jgi:hypothetical protein
MGCITLLSDFGMQDASAAIAKGILMQYNPAMQIIDVSHEVNPYHMGQAAYIAAAAFQSFPTNTKHLLLFDLFSEEIPKIIIAEHNGSYIFAPDNGIIPLMLGNNSYQTWVISEFNKECKYAQWLHHAAKTITALNSTSLDNLGLIKINPKVAPDKYLPVINDNQLLCDVTHIDHYENVAINVSKQQFESFTAGKRFEIRFKQTEIITKISSNFSDVDAGEKLCRFNSNDALEIGINRGSAASLFGLRLGGNNNNIKIILNHDRQNSTNELQI